MAKHESPDKGERKDTSKGEGKHVDKGRQPSGRGRDKADKVTDNELDPGR